MSKKIFNNIFLKIISAVLAVIVWLVLVNISDPTTSITISGVGVNFENESALTQKGYSYEVVDGNKISVDVTGPKSKITALRAADVSAVVDLSQMSEFSDYADISVSVKKDGEELNNISVAPKTSSVKLNVSNRTQSDFKVEVKVKGVLSGDKKIVDLSASPGTVRIAGPTEKVKNIAGVIAEIDISDKKDEISEDVNVQPVDGEGKVIFDDQIVLSRSTVRVTGRIISTKTIPISCSTQGNPAEGYEVKDVVLSTKQVTISGSEGDLEKINSFDIPSSAIDIEGISADTTYRIWLSDYAPKDVNVVSENALQATVRVTKKNQ